MSRGSLLVDAILGIAVVALIAPLIAGLASVTKNNARAAHKLQAGALADEELEALKRLDESTLSDQTNGPPLNILYNAGTWNLLADSSNVDPVASPCPPPTVGKHCGATVLELKGGPLFANKPTGRLLFPAGAYGDTTIQASWNILADSPNNWTVGFYLRARDLQNGYRLRLGPGAAATNVIFEKISNGTVTTLYTAPSTVTLNKGTWYNFRVDMSGSTFSLYKDGVLLTGATFTDATNPYLTGPVALAGWNGVHAEVDDATEVAASTCNTQPSKCWNFEGASTLPTAWTRFGINDLPVASPTVLDSSMTLTLEPWPAGATDMKRATVQLSWIDAGQSVTTSAVGFLRLNGIGQ